MKQKVINVVYRKRSEAFSEWMKYEVTLLNEDGSLEIIPAYGKDLQDALSRVVHDKKVKQLQKRTSGIPDIVWVSLWFTYILGWLALSNIVSKGDEFNGMFFIGGIILISFVVLRVGGWMKFKNNIKNW